MVGRGVFRGCVWLYRAGGGCRLFALTARAKGRVTQDEPSAQGHSSEEFRHLRAAMHSVRKTQNDPQQGHKFHCNTMFCHDWWCWAASGIHFRYSREFGPCAAATTARGRHAVREQ
jgi:hypothetical protein